MDGDGRVLFDRGLVLEPLEPTQDGVDAPAGPYRLTPRQHQPRDAPGVASRLGVLDGRLRPAVRLEPDGRPRMERRDHFGFPPSELGMQELSEQLVVAVPLAVAVKGDYQEVVAVQLFEYPARAAGVENSVAERTAQTVEDRRAGEERHLGARRPVEDLGAEIVAYKTVVAREGDHGFGTRAASLHGQRGQVQPGRPSLGALDEDMNLLARKLNPGPAQQRGRLPVAHGQLVRSNFDDAALRPQAGRRQRQDVPGGDSELRPCWHGQGKFRDGVETFLIGDRLGVVDDDGHRLADRPQGGDEEGDDGWARARRGEGAENRRADPLNPVQSHGQVGEEDGGVVVVVVGGQPRQARPSRLGPLRHERGLAVAGGRHHGDDSGAAHPGQAVQQRGAGHHPGAADGQE